MILVLGGARSGKSSFAERLAAQAGGPVAYIATSLVLDGEMEERVRHHRARRSPDWATLESPYDLTGAIRHALGFRDGRGERATSRGPDGITLIVDCLTVYLGNVLLRKAAEARGSGEWSPGVEDSSSPWNSVRQEEEAAAAILGDVREAIGLIKSQPGITGIVVSNEVGMGLVPPYPLGRCFRDLAGRANQLVASAADQVYLLVAGIPIELKASLAGGGYILPGPAPPKSEARE